MLKGSFKGLWNKAIFFMGVLWFILVYMIWDSGQLVTATDRQIFMTVVLVGFLLVYVFGFLIESLHKKKQAGE